MPGLVPGIHVFTTSPAGKTWMAQQADVDGRNKSGHDAARQSGHDAARQSGHDASRQSGHDVGCVARRPFPIFLIHFSNSPSSVQASSPVLFVEAPGRPVSFSSHTPRNTRGMARQVAQPLFFVAALPLESTGASRRAITALSLRHRAALFAGRFHFLETAMRQPAPGRRLLLATGRSPGAARVRALRKARARAPHPAPPSRRL